MRNSEEREPTPSPGDTLRRADQLRKSSYAVMVTTGIPWVILPETPTAIFWGVGAAMGIGGLIISNIVRNNAEHDG